jgi:hypothetical protein
MYKASIKIETHKKREYVALRAPIPSGAEILDSSLVTTGTVEEIYNLNQEAKQQPAYKTGEAFEIGGFVTMLAGAGIAWFCNSRMKKIKNAAGQTIATIGYTPTENGIAIAMRF